MIRKRCVLNRVFEKLLWNEKWRMVVVRRVAPVLHVALPGCPSFLLGPRPVASLGPPGRGNTCLKNSSGIASSGGTHYASILIVIARSAFCDDAIWFSTVLKNEIAANDKLDLIGANHCTLHLFCAAARLIPLACWHGIAEEPHGYWVARVTVGLGLLSRGTVL